jgi:CDP-diacylglycerol--glycerol-3-phosphate 3-phosphatidyltransferase
MLIPFFVVLLGSESRHNSFWAAIVFGAASATDFLDGYLARRLQAITTFGKFIDPLADKLITMAAYIVLVYLARIPTWVVLVILGREFIISGLRTIAISEGLVIAASQGGKWKTALQLAGISALIIHYQYSIDFLVVTRPVDFHQVGLWLTYLSLVPSMWSAYEYFRDFLGGVFEMREERTESGPPPPPPPRSPPGGPPSGVAVDRPAEAAATGH